MPRYEFHCKKCAKNLEVFLTVTEFTEWKERKCPECGEDLSQNFGAAVKWNTSGGTRSFK